MGSWRWEQWEHDTGYQRELHQIDGWNSDCRWVCKSYAGRKQINKAFEYGFATTLNKDDAAKQSIESNFVKKLVNKINSIKPDLIVFTGDLIDENAEFNSSDASVVTKYLNKLEASTGKYAVKGQHDYSKDAFVSIFMKKIF